MIALDAVKDYRVLLVGDAIMDEYVYVTTVGKAVKENALSSVLGRREVFKGGVWAAAAQVRGFCAHVDVWIGPELMWNSRLVDDIYLRKLFVTHEVQPNPEPTDGFDIKGYDLVIITDFGHGTVTKGLRERVTKEARFLAVNAQTNATNYGFNLITKYPRADFVVVDELEARLATREREAPIEDVILALHKHGFPKIIVTQGIKGAAGFDGAFERAPALTDRAIDTMGAGDAFLCVAAPYAVAGASMKDLLRIGNAAGAAKVGIVGHRSSVTREDLEKRLA